MSYLFISEGYNIAIIIQEKPVGCVVLKFLYNATLTLTKQALKERGRGEGHSARRVLVEYNG
jgi:hypothetical protein